jgi:mobilization protein NikA
MSFCLGKRSRWGPEKYGPQTPGRMRSAKETRKMGRPKATEPRTQQLNLSFSTSELEDIKKRAYALGMRPAHFGRALLLGNEKHPVSPTGQSRNINRLVHNQLIRLGSNLNQMVRHLHQTGDPLPPDLEPLLKDIRQLIARLSA